MKIGLLSKKRGNFKLQEKFAGAENVVDETSDEVEHHRQSLVDAGYDVKIIEWSDEIIKDLMESDADLIFNVSSMVEAALLEELEIPFVGSDTFTIAQATDKSLAKRIWWYNDLPTSPFHVARTGEDCRIFRENPPFDYPLFVKPVAGRGSSGITKDSVVWEYGQLEGVVERITSTIGQPALIERFLRGREITLGIVGSGEYARALPPLEVAYREGDITLTFDKKERDDDNFICPASLTPEETKRMQEMAVKAYNVLGFKDYGRIDTILTGDGHFILEGNTFAGLMCTPAEKPHSYVGFMVVAEGKGGKEILDEIVQSAARRYELS